MKKWLLRILIAVGVLLLGLWGLVWLLTWHPQPVEEVAVTCNGDAPVLQSGAELKVLNWNVQYMAGKDYVFWYDLLDGSGPDLRPERSSLQATMADVVRVIREEDPDVLLLQELDENSYRSDHVDQLALLLRQLPESWRCYSEAFYWKADFVPHPKVMGSVGMKLATLSKYRMNSATRHQLALIPADPVSREFGLKRAVLQTSLALQGGGELSLLNTHLDAFAQGTDTMQQQVQQVLDLLARENRSGRNWVLGGDFNLLPPGQQYAQLAPRFQAYYQPRSELRHLTERYASVPPASALIAEDSSRWYTHFPNDPAAGGLDRTIDYLFYSEGLVLQRASVRHGDALRISDHMPVIASFLIR